MTSEEAPSAATSLEVLCVVRLMLFLERLVMCLPPGIERQVGDVITADGFDSSLVFVSVIAQRPASPYCACKDTAAELIASGL